MRNYADPNSQTRTRELSLKTIWIGLGIAAVVFSVQGALLWWLLSPPRPFQLTAPVAIVRDVEAWKAHVPEGLRIVYLDCDWSVHPALFRPTFQEVAEWSHTIGIRCVDVTTDATPRVFSLCKQLVTDYGMDASEFERTYAVGWLLWLHHGRVVDAMDTRELMEFASMEEWFEVLKQRTRDVYSLSAVRK